MLIKKGIGFIGQFRFHSVAIETVWKNFAAEMQKTQLLIFPALYF